MYIYLYNSDYENYTDIYRHNGSLSVTGCFSWLYNGVYDICISDIGTSNIHSACAVNLTSVTITNNPSPSPSPSPSPPNPSPSPGPPPNPSPSPGPPPNHSYDFPTCK